MVRMRNTLAALLVVTSSLNGFAATPDEVIEWSKAGLAEAEIADRIRRGTSAPVGATDALRMKAAGVPDSLVMELINAGKDSAPLPTPEPATKQPEQPHSRVVATIDDIIDAHRSGVPEPELVDAVQRLRLRIGRADLDRMKAAGVPDSVIVAARSGKPAPRIARQETPDDDGFGRASGTFIVEIAGGLQSISVGDFESTTIRLAPGLHALISGIVTLGIEGDFVFAPEAASSTSFFFVAGVGVPIGATNSALLRLAARLGYGKTGLADPGPAYGFEIAALGRAGALLAGAGLTATWSGDPAVTAIAMDLRLGTWF